MKNLLITCVFLITAMTAYADAKQTNAEKILSCLIVTKKDVDSQNGQLKDALSVPNFIQNFSISLKNGEIIFPTTTSTELAAVKNQIISELDGGSFHKQISIYPNNKMTIYIQIQPRLRTNDAPYAFIGMFFGYAMSGTCFDTKNSM